MGKILRQEDLDPNGFVCTNDGKITPISPAVSFACPQLSTCDIDMLSGISLSGATAGQVLIFDGANVIATDLPETEEVIVTQTGHGFSIPSYGVLPIYMDQSSSLWLRANTGALERAHVAFVTEVLTPDTFIMKYSGVFKTAVPHALTVGETYYLQDAGTIAITEDAQIVDKLIVPINSESILLISGNAYETAESIADTSYVYEFVSDDFIGVGPYGITIYSEQHGLGDTKYIRVTVYEEGAPNIEVIAQIKVDNAGTVVVESASPFNGYVILTSHAPVGIIY